MEVGKMFLPNYVQPCGKFLKLQDAILTRKSFSKIVQHCNVNPPPA